MMSIDGAKLVRRQSDLMTRLKLQSVTQLTWHRPYVRWWAVSWSLVNHIDWRQP